MNDNESGCGEHIISSQTEYDERKKIIFHCIWLSSLVLMETLKYTKCQIGKNDHQAKCFVCIQKQKKNFRSVFYSLLIVNKYWNNAVCWMMIASEAHESNESQPAIEQFKNGMHHHTIAIHKWICNKNGRVKVFLILCWSWCELAQFSVYVSEFYSIRLIIIWAARMNGIWLMTSTCNSMLNTLKSARTLPNQV